MQVWLQILYRKRELVCNIRDPIKLIKITANKNIKWTCKLKYLGEVD